MRAAIYVRVSTEEQVQNFSIGNQIERLRKYCSDKEYLVAEEYIDPGYSGTTLERPALSKMIDDARNRAFDIILVYKLDRLFRSNRHMYNTLAEFEELEFNSLRLRNPLIRLPLWGKHISAWLRLLQSGSVIHLWREAVME